MDEDAMLVHCIYKTAKNVQISRKLEVMVKQMSNLLPSYDEKFLIPTFFSYSLFLSLRWVYHSVCC